MKCQICADKPAPLEEVKEFLPYGHIVLADGTPLKLCRDCFERFPLDGYEECFGCCRMIHESGFESSIYCAECDDAERRHRNPNPVSGTRIP
jgi:hypothetical protein